MAIELRSGRPASSPPPIDKSLLDEVRRLEVCVAGACPGPFSSLMRVATWMGVRLALWGAGASKHVELRADGYTIHDGVAPDDEAGLLHRIAASNARDNASGRARVALRPRPPEAEDRYFAAADDEDLGEVYPELERFREQTAFQMQRA